ncbi:MAG TPA: hypothetical protein ENH29_08710 [Bacteroidetes bacterium]|nr:hypothetical protein [Bacteroidota bacterium]
MKRIPGLFFLTSVLFLQFNCKSDLGIKPLPGTLGVDVIFLTKEIPENTEGVYLFVAPVFPPHAINELFLSPNSIPLDNDTVYTEIYLPYGHYQALGLWWYNKGTKSNLADIFTLKTFFDQEQFDWSVYEFDITPEQPYLRTKLPANLKRVNRDATIKGTIYFNGPFPENTLATAIAAYIQKPEEDIDYFVYLNSMDFSIDKNPYHYTLPVDSRNTIRYLAVFWLPERGGLGDFQTIGYLQEADGTPKTIRLHENETVTGMDINADWSKIIQIK